MSVWLFSLRNKTSTLFGELQTATSRPFNPTFSPDGQWVAYQSYESGSVNVYVQPFPATGAKYQIATVAWAPLWSPDSKELFYSTSNQITGVRLTTQPTFTVGEVILVAPSSAFAANAAYAPRSHDITPDGKRFIAVMDADPSLANPATEIRVALNWSEELKRLVHAP